MLGHDPNADIALLQGRSEGPVAAAAAARRQREGPGRRAGGGDRVAVRTGAVAVGRDRLRRRPRGRLADAVLDLGRDPDRRRDQPGQLRRAAGRRQRRRDRDQPADPEPLGGGEGVGFAVPINVVKRSIGQLRESGKARYAYLGVTSVPLYPAARRALQARRRQGRVGPAGSTPAGRPSRPGCAAAAAPRSFQGSPFSRGGDVITKIGGTPVENADDLSTAIAQLQAGRDRRRRDPPRRQDADGEGQARRAPARRPCRVRSGSAHERAAATGAGLEPRAGHLSGGRLRQARHRRPRDRADRPRLPPRRDLDRLGHDRPGRRGRPRARRQAVRGRGARGRLLPRAVRRVRRRGLRPLLQHHRQPDALVHPALPLGPEQRAGHPPPRGRGLQAGLPGRQPRPRGRRHRRDRGPGRARRDGPRLPLLHAPRHGPRGPPGRLPAPLHPHPVDPAGRLARAARRRSARRSTSGCWPTTSSASTPAPTSATSSSAAAT